MAEKKVIFIRNRKKLDTIKNGEVEALFSYNSVNSELLYLPILFEILSEGISAERKSNCIMLDSKTQEIQKLKTKI